ncbi:MAG TPA: DUF2723 domain-containing protein [Gemmatimonadales bacterium]|nr:DUF2723 domain-containing protein [Gemmatimonadales bacterium]
MVILPESLRSSRRVIGLFVVPIAAILFWRTAYPTITWWDSSEYSLAAATLGVIPAPGSLLLTLLGWPLAHLSFGSTSAHVLNLFAGVLAAITAGLVYIVALRILPAPPNGSASLGAAFGALAFAFGDTLWEHASKFTPYVLTVVFTGLILLSMLRWWEEAEQPDAWRWIALLGLLFGLDFSVHRTNALLLPGALVWILWRHPRALRSPKVWLGGASGLIAGLAVQLLIIPIAVFTRSPLNFNDPSTWSRFWQYVSLESRGGGFLVEFFPRNAPFWSVQVADLVRVLGANFLNWSGSAGVLGALPAIAAVGGLVVLWRRNRRLALAFACMLCLQMAATVLYFNIPAQYFRSFDRHYMPILTTIGVLVAYGVAVSMQTVTTVMRTRPRALAVGALAVLVPAGQLIGNWSAHDASRRFFTHDFAANALETLPPNAIFFTVGDNDTFPLLYLQAVEGVRRDVAVINLSLANLPWFAEQLQRRDPSFPLAMSAAERTAWAARAGSDTMLTIPVTGTPEELGLAPGTTLPKSIAIRVKPQYARMIPSEILLLDVVRANHWERPLCFAITGGAETMLWLKAYGRPDGLFWRIVPQREPHADDALLRGNLLTRSRYRGYADSHVRIDEFSERIGSLYHSALQPLLAADQARGDIGRCREDRNALMAAVPPARLAMPADMRKRIESACGAAR